MKSSLCIICGDKSPMISKRGRKRKKESVCERKLELMLGYLLDNKTSKFDNLKSNILKLKEGKAVGFCAKCELEAEAILELHLELEKVQMRMIDKLEGVKKLILKLDLEEGELTGDLGITLKDFQAAVKDNDKASVRIPLVFLEKHSFIRKENTTYLLLENQVKTEPVSNWDVDQTSDYFEDSTMNNVQADDGAGSETVFNMSIEPTQVKRGRGRPKNIVSTSSLDFEDTSEELNDPSNASGIEAALVNITEGIQLTDTKRQRSRPKTLKTIKNRKEKLRDLRRILKCETCSFKTSSRRPSRFEEHLRSHETLDRPLNCETCNEKFTTQQYFNFHLDLHKKMIPCEVCSEKYNALEAHDHLKTHVDVVLPCPKCHKCYVSPEDYFRHLKGNHEGQGLTCQLCLLPMQSQQALVELMRHLHKVHNIAEELKCDFGGCEKTFIHSEALAKHKILHTDLYTCKICLKRCCNLAWLRKHEMAHSELKLKEYKCDQCVAEYRSLIALESHIKIHHEGQRFKCQLCGKEYNLKAGLKSHMITEHGAVSKWICQICGKKCGSGSLLKRHVEAKHSTGTKYVCEECGKAFQIRRNYICHKKIHGEKSHKCSYCPSAFTKRKYLKQHERTHTNAKPFTCSTCGMAYRQWSTLSVHKRKCGKVTT